MAVIGIVTERSDFEMIWIRSHDFFLFCAEYWFKTVQRDPPGVSTEHDMVNLGWGLHTLSTIIVQNNR